MGKYTRQNLVDGGISPEAADRWWDKISRLLPGYAVVKTKHLHPKVRDTFPCNGGDEDWFVFVNKDYMYSPHYRPFWLDRTSTDDDPDEYDMGTYMVYVGSH
jgi:hypothetical protein